jgi:hypothetical protein
MLHMSVALVCAAPWLPPASAQPYPVKPVRMVVMKWTRPCADHCHRGLGTLYAAAGQWEQARTEVSTAIAMYQSMDMTFWLPETEAALAQVDAR